MSKPTGNLEFMWVWAKNVYILSYVFIQNFLFSLITRNLEKKDIAELKDGTFFFFNIARLNELKSNIQKALLIRWNDFFQLPMVFRLHKTVNTIPNTNKRNLDL